MIFQPYSSWSKLNFLLLFVFIPSEIISENLRENYDDESDEEKDKNEGVDDRQPMDLHRAG